MAIGLNISDALNGVTTLGSLPAHTASVQVANQHYAHTVLRSRGTGNRPYDYLRLCEVRQAVPQRDPYTGVRTCGLPGAPPCMTGGAQTALSGLGGLNGVSNWVCSDWAAVMTQMQVLLAKAEENYLTHTAEYVQARSYFDATTGPFQKPIFTCSSHTESAKMFYNALNARLGSPGVSLPTGGPKGPTTIPSAGGPGPSISSILGGGGSGDAVATALKWGVVGVSIIAGAYALGPLLRGLGSMVGKRK